MQKLPYFIYSIWFIFTILQMIADKSEAPYIFNSIMFVGSALIYFVASQKMHRGLAFVMGLFWPITLLMLLLYGMYRYSLWHQKKVTQPLLKNGIQPLSSFVKAFDIGLGSSPNGLKYCCANCGTRMGKGTFGNWSPLGLNSPCVESGKKCVPTRMP